VHGSSPYKLRALLISPLENADAARTDSAFPAHALIAKTWVKFSPALVIISFQQEDRSSEAALPAGDGHLFLIAQKLLEGAGSLLSTFSAATEHAHFCAWQTHCQRRSQPELLR